MKKIDLKKVFAAALGIHLSIVSSFVWFENGAIEAAAADDSIVSLFVATEITVACDDVAVLSGAVSSTAGGSAVGSFRCVVATPDSAGYSLWVKEDHALQIAGGGNDKEFINYAAGSPLDYFWEPPSPEAGKFGFSLGSETVNPVQAYKNNGNECDQPAGSVTNGRCWNGFTAFDQRVASSSVPSGLSGDAIDFNLKAQAAGSNSLQMGAYGNTVTVTAVVGS